MGTAFSPIRTEIKLGPSQVPRAETSIAREPLQAQVEQLNWDEAGTFFFRKPLMLLRRGRWVSVCVVLNNVRIGGALLLDEWRFLRC